MACLSTRLLDTWVFPVWTMMSKAAKNILPQYFLLPCVLSQVKYPGVVFWGLGWTQVSLCAAGSTGLCSWQPRKGSCPQLAPASVLPVILILSALVCAWGVALWHGISTCLMILRGTLFLLLMRQLCVLFCVQNALSGLFCFELGWSCGSFLSQIQVMYFYMIHTDAGV